VKEIFILNNKSNVKLKFYMISSCILLILFNNLFFSLIEDQYNSKIVHQIQQNHNLPNHSKEHLLSFENSTIINNENYISTMKGIFLLILIGIFYFLYRHINYEYRSDFLEQKQELFRQLDEQKKALDEHAIVAITDIKGTLTYVNDKFIQISGYSKEELIGANHRLLNSGFYEKAFWKEMYKTVSSKKTWKHEVCNKAKDGSLYWVDTTIVPILNKNQEIKNYIAIRTDITTRKVNETAIIKAKEKAIISENVKSEFLANMSHEIRTPLNAIIGFIEILQEQEKNKEKQEFFNIINNSSKNLLHIINDILDFSKIESGKLSIDTEPFNPNSAFSLIKDLFKVKLEEKKIGLIIEYRNLPESLSGDIYRITQVLNNLIGNAIKFTPEGKKIYLTISYSSGYLKINVQDEGIGISKEFQSKIFEVFSQEDSGTTRKYGGTGLGLAISHRLVKEMGGELQLKSEVGKGSEFYFSLALKKLETALSDDIQSMNIGFENKKVLLVEDNLPNQMFMKIIFKKLKLDFDIANNGLESISLFQKNRYDVILMDENMPIMSGTEATKEILNIEKKQNLTHTPIIALTANALAGDRKRFLDAGMDEYMTKPLDKNTLTSILNRIL